MELTVAIRLIEKGVDRSASEQTWADLGAGSGLFTRALASLLSPGSVVYAIDKDAAALRKSDWQSPGLSVSRIQMDFQKGDLGLEPLDGVLMANSLHFVKDKVGMLERLKASLKPSGRMILVEYNMDSSNLWVPYPISFDSLKEHAAEAGFASVDRIGEEPSAYNRANIYSAVLKGIGDAS